MWSFVLSVLLCMYVCHAQVSAHVALDHQASSRHSNHWKNCYSKQKKTFMKRLKGRRWDELYKLLLKKMITFVTGYLTINKQSGNIEINNLHKLMVSYHYFFSYVSLNWSQSKWLPGIPLWHKILNQTLAASGW